MEPHDTSANTESPPGIELEGALAPRASPVRRLRRVVLTALVCLVAGGVLLRELVLARPEGSVPTSLAPGPPGPAVLLSNVSFGTVTVNGQRLLGSPPLELPLQVGWNRIMYDAPPFARQNCGIQWSGSGRVYSDCPTIGQGLASDVVIDGLVVRPSALVVFKLSGGDLTPPLYAAARTTVAADLAAVTSYTDNVADGEWVAVGGHWPDDIASRQVTGFTRANAAFGLYDDRNTAPRLAHCGTALCAGGLFYTTASTQVGPVWNVAPDAYYVWHFSDGAGFSGASLPYPVSPSVSVPLAYDAAHGWYLLDARIHNGYPLPLAVLLDGTFCDAGSLALEALTPLSLGPIATVISNGGPKGCAIALQSQKLQPLGRYVWRWGVLLSADGEARMTLPDLPVASANEIIAVGG
jgi:hypothetical protein